MILKIFDFKKWNKDQMSSMKTNRDERNMETNKKLKCYQRMKINPKAFAIPFLTALC